MKNQKESNQGNRLGKNLNYKWQKLSKAAAYYGYKFKAHDSLEDVRATLYVYNKMQDKNRKIMEEKEY